MTNWTPRVLVVGWDGADWSLLQPMMDAGEMPVLAGLVAQAAWGPLRSTLPPVTGPAWTSFATGMLPGSHGVLSWQLPLDSGFRRRWVDSHSAERPRFWDHLGRAGLRSGVLGLPVTYPALPLEGVMVGGMLTPGLDSPFIEPVALRASFRARLPDYPFDVDMQEQMRDLASEGGILAYLREVRRALGQRERALEWLWEQGPFDCLTAVFEFPDRLQHAFYGALAQDGSASEATRATRPAMIAVYTELDAALGRLLARIDLDRTTLLMVSDHGFGPLRRDFQVSNWLVAQGFSAYAAARVSVRSVLAGLALPFRRWLPSSLVRQARAGFEPFRLLQWDKSVAYSGLSTEDGVWINLHGREPAGTVLPGAAYERLRAEIAAGLLASRDPIDGAQVVLETWRREELYPDHFRERAPDLVFRMADGYRMVAERRTGQMTRDRSAEGQGIHRSEGIFLAAGRGVRPAAAGAEPPHLVDIAPTLLALCGLAPGREMDGAILPQVIEVAPNVLSTESNAPGATSKAVGTKPISGGYTEEEDEMVRRRLSSLGYLD